MLKVRDVCVAIDGKLVVKRASMELHKREIDLLLGPNGSGKSSLLHAIAGLPKYRVLCGELVLEGVDLKDLEPSKRVELGIALAVQHPPRLRGVKVKLLLEKILSKKYRSSIDVEREILRIAKLLGIEKLLDRELGQGFSGGELKRVELATVIAMQPRIALIDEPDSGVDVDSVLLMANAIEEMLNHGTEAILIVTHSGFIAKHIKSSRAYIMVDGEIVAEGPSDSMLRKVLEAGFSIFRVSKHGEK